MTRQFADASEVMRRACELAERGLGAVEPNPAVGAVIVDDQLRLVGEGYHEQIGGPHAEVQALRQAGERARGGTLFVTLEPCCHTGRTPPCTRAVIAAGILRVVVGVQDPAPHANGRGLSELRSAGIDVEVGLLADVASRLIAPFAKRVSTGLPYVHAKWAMTLDGRIATRNGDSQWISNERARQIVHDLRGRMDAIVVGSRTATIDDPLLTARPPGPRTAVRIVFDSRAELPLTSRLVQTARDAPLLIAAHQSADPGRVAALAATGAEVLTLPAADGGGRPDPRALLEELGRREMTNVLVEGGGGLLGALFDRRLVDECHVFIASKIVGGGEAPAAVAGWGIERMADALALADPQIERIDDNVYVHGPLRKV
jgi:diaminohydroxyphosphoribosylaminopyrimidine deaminase / 5-amino-6-(5-phosphoribosylamino)uracil reductase